MAKISVIVPVYGVEAYIEKCAISLFEQTLDDIEYIFIDDCTPDNSIEILNNVLLRYPKRGNQVHILKMDKNSGQAAVRYRGINYASGEYIANCDSDDWVEKTMYEKMYNLGISKNADMVISDYYRSTDELDVVYKAFKSQISIDEIYKGFFSQHYPWCLWNKLIKKDLFSKDFFFPKHTHGEDMAIILQLLFYIKSIEYIEIPFYHYRVASNTIVHKEDVPSVIRRYDAAISNAKLVDDFYKRKGKNDTIENGIIHVKMTQRNKLISLVKKNKEYYHRWINTFPEINDKILNNSLISFKQKMKYILAKYRIVGFSE